MSIAIIGGLDRLKRNYEQQGEALGFKVRVFGRRVPSFGKRLLGMDGILVFTGMVAHDMVDEVNRTARQAGIPIVRSASTGISGFKRSLQGFKSG